MKTTPKKEHWARANTPRHHDTDLQICNKNCGVTVINKMKKIYSKILI
jgi:hypothetical protein